MLPSTDIMKDSTMRIHPTWPRDPGEDVPADPAHIPFQYNHRKAMMSGIAMMQFVFFVAAFLSFLPHCEAEEERMNPGSYGIEVAKCAEAPRAIEEMSTKKMKPDRGSVLAGWGYEEGNFKIHIQIFRKQEVEQAVDPFDLDAADPEELDDLTNILEQALFSLRLISKGVDDYRVSDSAP